MLSLEIGAFIKLYKENWKWWKFVKSSFLQKNFYSFMLSRFYQLTNIQTCRLHLIKTNQICQMARKVEQKSRLFFLYYFLIREILWGERFPRNIKKHKLVWIWQWRQINTTLGTESRFSNWVSLNISLSKSLQGGKKEFYLIYIIIIQMR